MDDDRAIQRLREFMQVFTPEGAMALAMERQQENKSLYNALQLANITPVAARHQIRLAKEKPGAGQAAPPLQHDPLAYPAQVEAPGPVQELPDFDTF